MLSTYHTPLPNNNQPTMSPLFPMNRFQLNNIYYPNLMLLEHAEQNLRLGQQQFQGKNLELSAYNNKRIPWNKIKAPHKPNKSFARTHRIGREAVYGPDPSNHGPSPHYNVLTLPSKIQKSTELDKPLIRTHRDKRASSYIPNPENTPLSEQQKYNSFPIKTPVIKQKSHPSIIGIGFMSRPKFSNIPPTIPYLSPPSPKTTNTIPEAAAIKQGILCERLVVCSQLFKRIFFELLPQSLQFPQAELQLYNKECKPIRTEANIAKCLNLEPRSIRG